MRVRELAKELNLTSKELTSELKKLNVTVKSPMSSLEDSIVSEIRKGLETKKEKEKAKGSVKAKMPEEKRAKPEKTGRAKEREGKPKVETEIKKVKKVKKVKEVKKVTVEPPAAPVELVAPPEIKRPEKPPVERPAAPAVTISIPAEVITAPPSPPAALRDIQVQTPIAVKDLAVKLNIKSSVLIKKLMDKGSMVSINASLDWELASKIAREFGFNIIKLPSLEESILKDLEKGDEPSSLLARAPVVTFMGHVDHGKTSLLDYIRKTKVTSGEAGGITQHIGAYTVHFKQGFVTFLDTPGHEAFTAMRARGAHATDVVVLVVAADDGVMPQTKEAISHARAAGVPIVVAINKIDLPNANLDKVKHALTELDLMPEDWGGKTITVGVSAKTGQGVDHLLEMLLLEAEMLELKANPRRPAKGVVIESKLTKGRGAVATVLVEMGTLHVGDVVVAGRFYGKVRGMVDDKGRRIALAPPSMAAEVMGISGVPEAGDGFFVVGDDKIARQICETRQFQMKEGRTGRGHVTLDDLYNRIKEGQIKELKIVLKADVQGSIEALRAQLDGLSTSEVRLNIIHFATGDINDSDIMLAAASNAIVIGFHVTQAPTAKERAAQEEVDVRTYDIIYDVTGDIEKAMEGMLAPRIKEIFLGRAQVKQLFKTSKAGIVAGCMVIKGKLSRNALVRVIRVKETVFEGNIASLKRFKDDVKEVLEGFDCGIVLQGFQDFKEGDVIEAYGTEQVARKLGESS